MPSRCSIWTRSSCSRRRVAVARRHCAPSRGGGRPPALRPEPVDEGRHEPGPEQLWNESWYFDAISEDGTLGLYTRLGLYPNLGVSWITAVVCGPGRDTLALVDFDATLPGAE